MKLNWKMIMQLQALLRLRVMEVQNNHLLLLMKHVNSYINDDKILLFCEILIAYASVNIYLNCDLIFWFILNYISFLRILFMNK